MSSEDDDHDSIVKQRYSFTLPPELISKLDLIGDEIGMNRSMIVREALTHWIEHRVKESKIPVDDKGKPVLKEGLSIFNYIYDHHDTSIVSLIMKVHHDYESEVNSVLSVQISHHKKFELIVCKGGYDKLKAIANRMRKIKELQSFTENYFV